MAGTVGVGASSGPFGHCWKLGAGADDAGLELEVGRPLLIFLKLDTGRDPVMSWLIVMGSLFGMTTIEAMVFRRDLLSFRL
jgi:hypothetical protein